MGLLSDFVRRYAGAVYAPLLMLVGAHIAGAQAADMVTLETKMSCDSIPVTIKTVCPATRRDVDPFLQCESQKMTVGRAEIDLKAEMTKRTGDKHFLGSLWACVEENGKPPHIYIEFGNGRNCDTCELEFWFTLKGADSTALDVAASGPAPTSRSVHGIALSP